MIGLGLVSESSEMPPCRPALIRNSVQPDRELIISNMLCNMNVKERGSEPGPASPACTDCEVD